MRHKILSSRRSINNNPPTSMYALNHFEFVSNKSGAQNYQKCLNVAINGLRVKFDGRKPREREKFSSLSFHGFVDA